MSCLSFFSTLATSEHYFHSKGMEKIRYVAYYSVVSSKSICILAACVNPAHTRNNHRLLIKKKEEEIDTTSSLHCGTLLYQY